MPRRLSIGTEKSKAAAKSFAIRYTKADQTYRAGSKLLKVRQVLLSQATSQSIISPRRRLRFGSGRASVQDITMDRANKISMAESILDYTFENKDLLWEALQAPGSNVVRLNGHLLSQGNKGLASLGDAVATLVIKLDCYTTNRSVGDTSTILQRTVNNTRFASLCNKIGLAACINRNPSQRGIISPRTCADTVEAAIGAVYQDGGIEKAKLVIQTLQLLEDDKYY